MATAVAPMTTEDLLAMPNTDMERWLIDGELRERPMTVRNRFHSQATIGAGGCLREWCKAQREPRGQVYGGKAGVRLRRDPDTTVGIDVVYLSADVVAQQTDEMKLIEGVPTLAVEILSPNDTVEQIEEKLQTYIKAGVPLIWIVNPYQQNVTVYQPGKKPVLVNADEELTAEPHLPGFRVKVAEFFR